MDERAGTRRTAFYVAFAVFPVIYAVWIVATADYKTYCSNHMMDVGLYEDASLRWLEGQWPFRDFPLEYPPFALFGFALPRLLAFGAHISERTYICLLLLLNMAAAVASGWLMSRLVPSEQRSPAVRIYALLAVISSTIWPWRFDAMVALLCVAGFYCMVRRKPVWAGVWLGLGIAAKLYPVILLAGCLAWMTGRKQWQPAIRIASASAAAAIAVTLPFALAAPTQWLSFIEYHRARGIQLESVTGGLVELAGILGLTTVKPDFNHGAFHLISPWAEVALQLQFPLFVIAACASLYWIWRQANAARTATDVSDTMLMARAALIMLLVFIVTNKVFSAQYVVWLAPFIPILERRMAFRFASLFILTTAIFPYLYMHLVYAKPEVILLLNARNLLACGLIWWLLQGLRVASPPPAPVTAFAGLPPAGLTQSPAN